MEKEGEEPEKEENLGTGITEAGQRGQKLQTGGRVNTDK